MKKNVVLLILCVFFPGRAFAEICTAPVATPGWGLAYSAVYATKNAASAACTAKLPSLAGISHSGCNYAGSPHYYYYIDDYTNHSHYKFGHCACEYYDPVTSECSDCSAKRAELEETCGEPGYILDEETCEGECVGCPDSDDDGVKDACDYCPDDPDYGRKQLKIYKVPRGTICGTYLYAGEECGFSVKKCDGSEEFFPINERGIDWQEMYNCCKGTWQDEQCVVDEETCDAVKGDDVCECPDGSKDCDLCPQGDCTCPDTDGDGQPNSPCDQCQMEDCECPDTNGDGEPDSPCLDCQDGDGDGQPDGGGGGGPDTDGDGTPDDQDDDDDGDDIPDDQDPCPKNPDPNCEDVPPDDPSEPIPDVIDVGPCKLDITKIKRSINEEFPFNWIKAYFAVTKPLFRDNSEPPYLEATIDMPLYGPANLLKGMNDYLGSSQLRALAFVSRWGQGVLYSFAFALLFMKRYRNLFGIGGS